MITFCETTRLVAVIASTVKLPVPPGNNGADKASTVSPLWKLHVNVAGVISVGVQTTVLTTDPLNEVEKLTTLSL